MAEKPEERPTRERWLKFAGLRSVRVTRATVRWFSNEEGWGVLDAPEAPGGAFVIFSEIEMEGYRTLHEGQEVEVDEMQGPLPMKQDGCDYIARGVRPLTAETSAKPRERKHRRPKRDTSGLTYTHVGRFQRLEHGRPVGAVKRFEHGRPDGAEEHLFVPLAEDQPELATRLSRHYAKRWLAKADLPGDRLEEAVETVELRIAPADREGFWRLRLTSFYTGTTYWLYDWDRTDEAALTFMDECADLQGENVKDDRRHGPTPWDRPRKRKG